MAPDTTDIGLDIPPEASYVQARGIGFRYRAWVVLDRFRVEGIGSRVLARYTL